MKIDYSRTVRIFFGICAIGVIVLFWNQTRKQAPQASILPKTNIVCTKEYSPVCGVDGVTYANACIASDQNGIVIAAQGECPPQSNLAQHERKFLFWLLRERQTQGLPNVRIRHYVTLTSDCPDCYSLYYAWGDPLVQARIVVRDGEVVSAQDTSGFEYIQKNQGAPIDFPELLEKVTSKQ